MRKFVGLLGFAFVLAACGGGAAVGGACTRASDCAAGLFCSAKKCATSCPDCGGTTGSTTGTTGNTAEFSLAFNTATIDVDQGQSQTATLTLTRDGSSVLPVGLSVVITGDGVTATGPDTMVSGAAEVTLAATATASLGDHTITVTGALGSVTHSTSITVHVRKSIVVTLVSGKPSTPPAGIKVRVGAEWFTSDAEGKVHTTSETDTYDVTVLSPFGAGGITGSISVSIYKGVSTSNLSVPIYDLPTKKAYTIPVTFTGSGPTTATSRGLALRSPQQIVDKYVNTGDPSYGPTVDNYLAVGTAISGTLFGGRWSDTQFAFASAPISYAVPESGAATTLPTTLVQALATDIVRSKGQFGFASALSTTSVRVLLTTPQAQFELFVDSASGSTTPVSFDRNAPKLTDGVVTLDIMARNPTTDARSRIMRTAPSTDTTNLVYTLPMPPSLSAPADAAIGVTVPATYTWATTPGLKSLQLNIPTTKLYVYCYTMADACEVEDYAAIDPAFAWPKNKGGTWQVTFDPAKTVDAAIVLNTPGVAPVAPVEMEQTMSDKRAFTTAP